jgi:hypothetical protein
MPPRMVSPPCPATLMHESATRPTPETECPRAAAAAPPIYIKSADGVVCDARPLGQTLPPRGINLERDGEAWSAMMASRGEKLVVTGHRLNVVRLVEWWSGGAAACLEM